MLQAEYVVAAEPAQARSAGLLSAVTPFPLPAIQRGYTTKAPGRRSPHAPASPRG